MSLQTFLANFFRQNANESSTRLVGILCFVAAIGLTCFVVLADKSNGSNLTAVGVLFANGCIALGLRKRADAGAASAASQDGAP